MLRCKKMLDAGASTSYIVHRSNAASAALSAFLDVSSLNLAGPQSPAIFFAMGFGMLIGWAVLAQRRPAPHGLPTRSVLGLLTLVGLIGLVGTNSRQRVVRLTGEMCSGGVGFAGRLRFGRHYSRCCLSRRSYCRGLSSPRIQGVHCRDAATHSDEECDQSREGVPRQIKQLVFFFGTPPLAKIPGWEGLFEDYVIDDILGVAGPFLQLGLYPILALGL